MTIPARIVVGMLVDKFGPRILFSSILVLGGLISIAFAWAGSYESLAIMRFLSGFIGAGFVVGIRMIGEWFPAKQTGLAQGIYGGWGNFGSAGAAATLPFIAASMGGDDGWRYAITFAIQVLENLAGEFSCSLKKPVPAMQQYKFKQVAILDWAYLVTFGTELAVVSMLAMFYVEWFDIPKRIMSNSLAVTVGQSSTAGIKPDNEDFLGYYIPTAKTDDAIQLESKGIAVAIADGMSGSDGGKEASQVSVNQFLSDYYGTPESWTVKQAATKILTALNTWLYSQGQEKYGTAKGMVTTFSALVLKSQTVHMFHVGDSRIYRLRDNDLVQMTRDHRVWITNDRDYLSRAIGIDTHLEIDYRASAVQEGDVYLLTTDGVHDFVSDKEIQEVIESNKGDPQKATENLIKAAKQNDSNDNISAQFVKIDVLPEPDKTEFYEQLTQLPFPPDLKAGNIIDGYKILRELNASSRSQVYLAEDTLMAEKDAEKQKAGYNKVVIKTPSVNFEDDPSYIDLFLHEEWVAKRLQSPHLIKIRGVDRKRTFLYTVVEYVQGQSLKQWMLDNPSPTLIQVRGTIDQIARGLRSMHRLEMIHQDLKPDNILLDDSKTLKIIDFGSTKIAGLAEIKSVVEHNQIVGTANYSAPEYFKGGSGTNRSDIFSLGVIAYEILTGKLPYGEISAERASKKKFNYVSARQFNPIVPDWMDACLQKAVHPNPEKRYGLLSEFLSDFTDLKNEAHSNALVDLLSRYALGKMGGGKALSEYTKSNLPNALLKRSDITVILAFNDEEPIGLINCIEGFSTFACKPLMNIHDVYVAPDYRGQGIATRLLQEVEKLARKQQCCKITLEVLEGNEPAKLTYQKFGFDGYELDPNMVHNMTQKILLVSDEAKKSELLENYLLENSYTVNRSAMADSKIQESILVLKPDLVIIYTEAAEESILSTIQLIQQNTPLPIIIFAKSSKDKLIADAIIAGASGFVIDGVDKHRMCPIIEVATARFNKCQSIKTKLTETELKLNERKDIDRAKGILMSKKNIQEDEAYKLLRKMAMDKNVRMGELAKTLITASELL
ncbi:Serine/threonine-protein kinase PrkC [Nymphon striatum]|nr:Serine/threonine-protein kinase PrkC [Nymphon striatum]